MYICILFCFVSEFASQRNRYEERIKELETQNARIRDVIRQMRVEMEQLQSGATLTDVRMSEEKQRLEETIRGLRSERERTERELDVCVYLPLLLIYLYFNLFFFFFVPSCSFFLKVFQNIFNFQQLYIFQESE